ncbi:histidine kinase [Methylopila musalis]|uniref:Histidine kinase n=1 Tax=Methylopila musalis TaxID=1134781 RepID=A0ABW3Z5I3_9HYPH
MMIVKLGCGALVAGLWAAGAVAAPSEDAAKCDEGIALIRAEQAKSPPADVAAKLKTALRVAEREKGEAEYDECLDAVQDARKALGAKR